MGVYAIEAYGCFAAVYDLFMSNTPYDKWVYHLEKIWEMFEQKPNLILELGCGTGNITSRLAKKGYDMIGIDLSSEMLAIAKEKPGPEILYLNQDMREFELYGTVDSIICLCDGLNYILDSSELLAVFKLVNNYLNPGGFFIFDLNTTYKYSEILADRDFCEITGNAAYIWQNYYDEESEINEYDINFFLKNKNGSYNRFNEAHYQRGYSTDSIKELLVASGMNLLKIFDMDNLENAAETSERICFAAQGGY